MSPALHRSVRPALLAALVHFAAGCSGAGPAAGPLPGAPPPSPRAGPVVVVDRAKLAPTRAEACAHVAAEEGKDPAKGALGAGVLLPDYEGFRATTARHPRT